MAKNPRNKTKGRQEKAPFLALPQAILKSGNYISLSMLARALLIDISMQYNGSNNGDLGASFKKMSQRGWKSKQTLSRKIQELIEKGFIIKTRQGGLHKCSLYAITWQPIDECKGKLDIPSTRTAPGTWKK